MIPIARSANNKTKDSHITHKQIKICHPSKNSITLTHKNNTPTETNRQGKPQTTTKEGNPNNRDHNKKPQTQRTTGKKLNKTRTNSERRRNHTCGYITDLQLTMFVIHAPLLSYNACAI